MRITRITQRIHLGRITDSADYAADSPRRITPDYADYTQVLVTDYTDSPRTDYADYRITRITTSEKNVRLKAPSWSGVL